MKIWVCRDSDGSYTLIEKECSPSPMFISSAWWMCHCDDEDHRVCFTDELIPEQFKSLFGLKRHLKPGTKKLMTWTLPLARQPKKGEKR